MSVEDLSNKVTYSGDGSTIHFPYTFPLQLATDMQVWITDAAGNQTLLTANYQVDTVDAYVIYPTTGSPLAADGSTITLLRVVPLTQEVVLTDNGPLPATVLGQAYDKLTMIAQQIMEVLGRTLQWPVNFVADPADTTDLLAEILAGAANAAAAAASATAAAASAASLGNPIPVAKGGTNSQTALVNGKFMQSNSGKIVESAIDVASFAGFPTGGSIDFRGTTPPSGWLLEDGSIVSQTTYAALFAVIGTIYSGGDEGAGNFRLPDSRGRVNVGAGKGAALTTRTLGQIFGEEDHLLAISEMPLHGHAVNDPGHAHSISDRANSSTGSGKVTVGGDAVEGVPPVTDAALTGITIGQTGGGGSHNNMQPSLVATKIIKT